MKVSWPTVPFTTEGAPLVEGWPDLEWRWTGGSRSQARQGPQSPMLEPFPAPLYD